MRKDIEIHINTGDITLNPKNRMMLRDFHWVERPEDMEQRYLYGEVSLSANVLEDTVLDKGLYFEIPYTPIYKEFKLRIRRIYNDTDSMFVFNPKDGSEWFVVQSSINGQPARNVYASELMSISENRFYISFSEAAKNGALMLYSGNESDVSVIKANWQNRNLLLKCVPGNNYRYPLTGVGLIRWTNSNISVSELAETLKKQFAEDGTPVIAAKYDFDAKQLYINVDTSNVDGDAEI